MIICQCNLIKRAEVVAAIHELLDEEPYRLIVPLQVYHRLARRGRCCGCFPGVVGIIEQTVKDYHEAIETPLPVVAELLQGLRDCQKEGAGLPMQVS
ncbi:MAG: (2Fe-2S)-binding protein [Ahrensia sp.]|nr:(2Fe-2S)-binding protein [Ahrensia sp.]